MTRDHLLVRRRPGDLETPVSAMLKLGADEPGSFLFESIHGGERLGRYSFIGLHPKRWMRVLDGVGAESSDLSFTKANTFEGTAMDALRAFAEAGRADADAAEELPPMASGAFGYIGYDFIQHVEPVSITKPDTLEVPEALLVIPGVVLIFDHLYQELILVGRHAPGEEAAANALLDRVETALESPPPLSPRDGTSEDLDFVSNTSQAQYFDMVETSRDYIKAGDIFQVVPSQRFSAPFKRKSISFYRALRRLNPSAFMFHMNLGDVRLVGSSPEILVRVREGRVAIRPIAGTRPRSGDPVIDADRKADLLADQKEIAEHLMLLDLGRNDVGRVAAYGSVEVTERFIVERYSHVMHIVSHVEGNLREGLTAVD
ncbi:MAG: chorismate-binding protein, partial [Pseudomonadota bacterium]